MPEYLLVEPCRFTIFLFPLHKPANTSCKIHRNPIVCSTGPKALRMTFWRVSLLCLLLNIVGRNMVVYWMERIDSRTTYSMYEHLNYSFTVQQTWVMDEICKIKWKLNTNDLNLCVQIMNIYICAVGRKNNL